MIFSELAVYRRSDSRVWQYKFKQETGRWFRTSTRKTILEQAIRVASDLYDESRYRERLGLEPQQKTFKDIDQTACLDMRRELSAGTGKKIYVDYCSVIELRMMEKHALQGQAVKVNGPIY